MADRIQEELSGDRLRRLPRRQLRERLAELRPATGSNPAHHAEANHLIDSYRRELDRRASRDIYLITFAGALAALVAAVASVWSAAAR